MIILKSKHEIEKMRVSNQIVVEILMAMLESCKPGITPLDLDRMAEEMLKKRRAKSAFKGYFDYPSSVCVSINEVVVHGIPHNKSLKDGDIVSIDFGAIYDGFVGDAAFTIPIGKIPENTQKLLKVTQESLYKGIEQAVVGNRLSHISKAIQSTAESYGFSVVREFVGHGIGRRMHEDPIVPNYDSGQPGPRLKPGMVLAIEPMVNMGGADVLILSDNWTAITKDRSLSAHFEHSIAITENGPDILSRFPRELSFEENFL